MAVAQNVEHQFTEVARDPRVTFLGNVRMGTDLQLADLQRLYSGVTATAQFRHCRCPAHKQSLRCPAPHSHCWAEGTGWVPAPGGSGLRSGERQEAGHPWRGAPHMTHSRKVGRRHIYRSQSVSGKVCCFLGKP